MLQVDLKIAANWGVPGHAIRKEDNDYDYYFGILSNVLNIGCVVHKKDHFIIEVEDEAALKTLEKFPDFKEFVIVSKKEK